MEALFILWIYKHIGVYVVIDVCFLYPNINCTSIYKFHINRTLDHEPVKSPCKVLWERCFRNTCYKAHQTRKWLFIDRLHSILHLFAKSYPCYKHYLKNRFQSVIMIPSSIWKYPPLSTLEKAVLMSTLLVKRYELRRTLDARTLNWLFYRKIVTFTQQIFCFCSLNKTD